MLDLEPFRTAATIRWVRHTVFAPHRGDDGNLVTDHGHSIPLDTWPTGKVYRWNPNTFVREEVDRLPVNDEVGMVVVDPETLEDVHGAVVEWCRSNLGRCDVSFSD